MDALKPAGQLEAGKQQKNILNFQAAQEVQAGGQSFAAAQRRAYQASREANLVSSAATARAASSGGGATDPTVLNIISRIQGQGDYNALSALYEGKEAQSGMVAQAAVDRIAGRQAEKAAQVQAISTIIDDATGLAKGGAYGGGG